MTVPWADDELEPAARARALLDAARSRGEVKRLGKWLDGELGAQLRPAVMIEGRRRGAELPDDAVEWAGKKLIRVARAHQAAARERSNPIRRDEAFSCAHCHAEVPAHGRTARDHCPHCLRSLHVDVVPGDRAAHCGGILDPVAYHRRGDDVMLTYRCRSCGAERKNRALLDGEPPDSWAAILDV